MGLDCPTLAFLLGFVRCWLAVMSQPNQQRLLGGIQSVPARVSVLPPGQTPRVAIDPITAILDQLEHIRARNEVLRHETPEVQAQNNLQLQKIQEVRDKTKIQSELHDVQTQNKAQILKIQDVQAQNAVYGPKIQHILNQDDRNFHLPHRQRNTRPDAEGIATEQYGYLCYFGPATYITLPESRSTSQRLGSRLFSRWRSLFVWALQLIDNCAWL